MLIKEHEEWVVLDRQQVLDGSPWLTVYKELIKLPDGREISDFYQIEQRDYAEIVAVRSDGKILGLWQYKHGARKTHLGLPAGYIEKNEDSLAAAQRELAEEGILESQEWSKLGEFVVEGNRGTSKAHLYLAKNCQVSKLNLVSDDLDTPELTWLTLNEWFDALSKGHVALIGTVTAILLAKEKLD